MGERHLGLLAKTTAQYSIAAVTVGGGESYVRNDVCVMAWDAI